MANGRSLLFSCDEKGLNVDELSVISCIVYIPKIKITTCISNSVESLFKGGTNED